MDKGRKDGRRDSIKSAMLKSLLSASPKSMTQRVSKSSFKSSQQVVTSSGSKIAVYESQKQSCEESETVDGETKTETSHSAAERYCELESDEAHGDFGLSSDMKSLMDGEFQSFMDRPMLSLLNDSAKFQEDEVEDTENNNQQVLQCEFGICPEDAPCMCYDDCSIDVEEETTMVQQLKETTLEG